MTMLAAMVGLGVIGNIGDGSDFNSIGHEPRHPKTPAERNKFGLSEEERERMSGMSPKEKKRFLKERNGG